MQKRAGEVYPPVVSAHVVQEFCAFLPERVVLFFVECRSMFQPLDDSRHPLEVMHLDVAFLYRASPAAQSRVLARD